MLCAASATLVGCAAPAAGGAQPGSAHGPRAGTAAVEVARGVYMVQGASGEVSSDNLGRVGNSGFIVGESGVLAIDTGTSYRHGKVLLDAIHRVTDKPVRLALVTHTRQEFLFGASAFREQGIPVHMHRQAAGLMQSRCDRCLKTLRQVLGDDEMRSTAMWKPDREFDESETIDAIGRPVQVIYAGHSSGPGDVAVFDPRTGVLFAGGMVDHRRIPDVQDGALAAWRSALRQLRQLPLKTVVPGHGPPGPPESIDHVDRYLAHLEQRVLELLVLGAALSEVADEAALPDYARWDQYETIHRRNASVLFVRLERDEMFKRAGAPP